MADRKDNINEQQAEQQADGGSDAAVIFLKITVQALQPAQNHQQAQRNAEHIGNRRRGKQQQQAKQNVQHTEHQHARFDMAQHIVSGAAGVIGGDTNIDVTEALAAMQEGLKDMEIPELLLLVMETSLVSLCMKIMSVLITVILYGRMIEIYAYCSVSPIPFATMTNREWGQIGNSYLKGLFALSFQGFLIMICVGIYAVLVNDMIVADNLHSAIFSLAAYTVILCFSLFKSGALAKQIFQAH